MFSIITWATTLWQNNPVSGLIKWLIELYETKPRLFNIAMLLLIMGWLVDREIVQKGKIAQLEQTIKDNRLDYENKVDSLMQDYQKKEEVLQAENKATLNMILQDYKQQLNQQTQLNHQIDSTILAAKRVVKRSKNKLNTYGN